MKVQKRKLNSLKDNLWNITGFPVLSYITVNALLLLYDLRNPGILLIGDRAGSRFNKIELIIDRIQSGTSLKEIIISNGDPFDYLYHLLPYYFFGEIGVTVCQIVLYTIGIIFFSKLCNLLFNNKKITTIAVFLYAFLPSSIFTTHVLVTEAFFNPFIIIYTYYIVKYIQGSLSNDLLTASIFATLAIAARQVFLLFPPLVLLLAFVFKKKLRMHLAIIALLVTLLLPAACLSYFYLETGRLSYGKSTHSLSFNLYHRVSRMSKLEKISRIIG